MHKLSLCVIFGGKSSEHEVSRVSAASVIKNLDMEKYHLHMIGITKGGRWLYYSGPVEKVPTGEWESDIQNLDPAIISPDSGDKGILLFKGGAVEKIKPDAVFPVLHGKNGEDGTIQGLLALAGIPCVGSGVIGSGVCMDKCVAKVLFEKHNIPTAEWVELKCSQMPDIEMIEKKLGYPCFVKPANAGSSVGVTKAADRAGLTEGIKAAFVHDYKILIEKGINAREVECSVMGNLEPEAASVIGEIVPANEFYDYDAKYNDENSRLYIPAKVDDATREKIRGYAVRAYAACECRGLARVDFLVDKTTGAVFLNEINTIPGFTSISMYPKLWEASGLSYAKLIDRLIELAMEECV